MPEKNLLLDLYGAREDNTWLGATPSGLISDPSPTSPFLHQMPFLPQPFHFILAWDGTKYAGLHNQWRGSEQHTSWQKT